MSPWKVAVHIVSRRAFVEVWKVYPGAQLPLAIWFRTVERTQFADFDAVKRTYRTADYMTPFTIFDVAGNRYRIITVIHYDRGRVYVHRVLTRADYDDWSEVMR